MSNADIAIQKLARKVMHMPLRALSREKSINAFECDESSWIQLKKSYKAQGLRLPCCESLAIPKTSSRKTFFFSHSRRGECTTAPESAEHIYLKTLIAKAAVRAGWSVYTEWSGETPMGKKWIADVLCEKGTMRIALEVQWSYQTAHELRERQTIYQDSGVRAAWFASAQKFPGGYISPSKEIPFFRIPSFALDAEPYVHGFNMSVSEFVIGLLQKKLSWESEFEEYDICYVKDICWKCSCEVKQIFGSAVDVYGDSAKTVPNMSAILNGISQFVTNDELKVLGLNTIGFFDKLKGNAPGYPYCNVCIGCGAPQSNYHVMKKIEDGRLSHLDLESEPTKAGYQRYVSTRKMLGSWRYEK
jgi:Competence protein CoiA-like family